MVEEEEGVLGHSLFGRFSLGGKTVPPPLGSHTVKHSNRGAGLQGGGTSSEEVGVGGKGLQLALPPPAASSPALHF